MIAARAVVKTRSVEVRVVILAIGSPTGRSFGAGLFDAGWGFVRPLSLFWPLRLLISDSSGLCVSGFVFAKFFGAVLFMLGLLHEFKEGGVLGLFLGALSSIGFLFRDGVLDLVLVEFVCLGVFLFVDHVDGEAERVDSLEYLRAVHEGRELLDVFQVDVESGF